ncbi:MAG: redoxin domain-containing protein [Bacteroidaceae bacterium]|nr:redoxin domain-containing protein [Bacteroidaceae bacterium]
MLYLEASTLDGIKKLDSVKLKADGSFSFKADAPVGSPEFYILRIHDRIINFSIDSTETVTFKAKYPTMATDYTVEGSENCQKIKEINILQQKVQKDIISLEKNENMYPGDILDSINSIISTYKEKIKQEFIFAEPSKAYAYYAVCQSITDLRGSFQLFNPISDRSDVRCYATVATSWDYNYPDAKRTQQICNMAIKGMENTAKPTEQVIEVDEDKIKETGILDINLPDINSKIHSIKDLKGKVVMLDFTMFGEKGSQERTRILRELYNKYHDKGFEIYQISLDEDIHFWKSSVEYLPWICVHETDGAATNTYGVSTLPTYFIIDRNNEVYGRSGMMEGTLEEQIQKLL